jgi:hypothetical protein
MTGLALIEDLFALGRIATGALRKGRGRKKGSGNK